MFLTPKMTMPGMKKDDRVVFNPMGGFLLRKKV
jgi:hypothetical protein